MSSDVVTAIFFQAGQAPTYGRTRKPMKPGGYADSGADIAYGLQKQRIRIVTPVEKPNPAVDNDWVFPDTSEGLEWAFRSGARCFWLNTVLFSGHPMEQWFGRDVSFVGQLPACVDMADDKYVTNGTLRAAGLAVASAVLVATGATVRNFPGVLKPVRGRGSQGVSVVNTAAELDERLRELTAREEFGSEFIWEELLPGQEITVTVLPSAGDYRALPPVERFNHVDGIAPYSGKIAVVKNSRVLSESERRDENLMRVMRECEVAARMVGARAPVRIDCRRDEHGLFKIFDLNMKPNITGPGRPGREDQTSLMGMAAEAIGWSYAYFLREAWSLRWQRE